MGAPGNVSDLEINNNIRRIMTKRRIDVNKITYRTSHGTVMIGGELKFVGKKFKPDELVHEIEALESFITGVKGVKDCKIDFDGYEKSDEGDWLFKGKTGAPEKKVTQKSEEELLKEKIKARVLESLENMQYNPESGEPAETGTTTGDSQVVETQNDTESVQKRGLATSTKAAVEEFLSSIKSLVIKCGDCDTEIKYCPQCGDKIKISFITDEEEWDFDGKNVVAGKKSTSGSAPAVAPMKPKANIHDLLAADDEESGIVRNVKKEEKKEEKKELSLAERAKLMLQKSKEAGIKSKGWMKKSPPKVDFDDF